MTGSAVVRNQSVIAFFQSVDALVHYTLHPQLSTYRKYSQTKKEKYRVGKKREFCTSKTKKYRFGMM
jgi:hypothetical protein